MILEKSLSKIKIEMNFLNVIKGIYKKNLPPTLYPVVKDWVLIKPLKAE